MLRKRLMLSASLGLAIASTAPARADICFEFTVSGGFGIAIGAKVPFADQTCERVTVVAPDGAVATGSICKSEQSRPTLVYEYVLTACNADYFEAATCRLDLEINGDLPSSKTPGQPSICTGVSAGMAPGGSSPLHGFNLINDLKAWNCTPGPFAVVGGGSATCLVRGKGQ
jgi:hypothetical protein